MDNAKLLVLSNQSGNVYPFQKIPQVNLRAQKKVKSKPWKVPSWMNHTLKEKLQGVMSENCPSTWTCSFTDKKDNCQILSQPL